MMRISKYTTLMDEHKIPYLVKESSCNYPVDCLDNPRSVVNMINEVFMLNKQTEEYLYMLALTAKCKLIGVFEISHGTVDMSIVNPREIFLKALLCGAHSIILVHNHPSGDAIPSDEDLKCTDRVEKAGHILGVELIDHIIVGGSYHSIK